MRNRTVIWKALAALVVTITIGACSGTPHVRSITLTFIRHAESQSNADHVINTDIPGPSLTEEGQAQAEQLAHQLSRNNFDAVYASDMVRTQADRCPAGPRSRQAGRNPARSAGKSTPAGTTTATDEDRWLT